jgi:hypothetical protein
VDGCEGADSGNERIGITNSFCAVRPQVSRSVGQTPPGIVT